MFNFSFSGDIITRQKIKKNKEMLTFCSMIE